MENKIKKIFIKFYFYGLISASTPDYYYDYEDTDLVFGRNKTNSSQGLLDSIDTNSNFSLNLLIFLLIFLILLLFCNFLFIHFENPAKYQNLLSKKFENEKNI